MTSHLEQTLSGVYRIHGSRPVSVHYRAHRGDLLHYDLPNDTASPVDPSRRSNAVLLRFHRDLHVHVPPDFLDVATHVPAAPRPDLARPHAVHSITCSHSVSLSS